MFVLYIYIDWHYNQIAYCDDIGFNVIVYVASWYEDWWTERIFRVHAVPKVDV